LDDDCRLPKSGDQPVPPEEAPGSWICSVFSFGEQTPSLERPLKQVMVGARIRRVEPRRKHNHGSPSSIDRPFVRRAIDPNGSARDDDQPIEHSPARYGVRKVERFIISTTSAND